MLPVNIVYIASHNLFHVQFNNQDGSCSINLFELGKQTIPSQEDVIVKNRLNLKFSLDVNEKESRLCEINHIINYVGSK